MGQGIYSRVQKSYTRQAKALSIDEDDVMFEFLMDIIRRVASDVGRDYNIHGGRI